MIFANARSKLRIVQQQISQLGALLNKVQLRHTFRFTLKFFQRNTNELAQDVTSVVKGQRLIEIAYKQKVL